MKFDILTLFPEMIDAVMQTSIIGRAQQAGLVSIQAINIRDFTLDKHNRVDDTPYGGGKGMVMQADPLFRCHQHVTGGEIPAMAVTDAVCRMVPGVLAEEVCFTDESHWNGLLEYPQYTKPAVWHDREVPEVLLSGHHANIDRWRRKQSLARTRKQRPDLFEQFEPQGKQDQKILDEIYLEDGIVRF